MKEFSAKAQSKVLIVNEHRTEWISLSHMVEDLGLNPIIAENGKIALDQIIGQQLLPDLFLIDISMPEMNGFELCEILKRNIKTRDIPVIFLSNSQAVEHKVRGFHMGGVDYIEKPFVAEEVTARIMTHLRLYQTQKEQKDYNKCLNEIVNDQMKQILQERKNLLLALAKLGDKGADFSGSHMWNVSMNSRLLAQAMQLCPIFENEISNSFIETIELAAPLHDLGKLLVPYEILHKQEKLNEEEKRLVKSHAEAGARILTDIYKETQKNEYVKMAIEIARYHHERWDGNGYPYGLKGKDIPLAARIVSITGAYDTLTGERCYKKSISPKESMEILSVDSGKCFDPDIFEVFQKIEKQLKSDER